MIAILLSSIIPFLISIFLGWLVTPRVLLVSHKKRLFDQPGERKVHNRPVPRLGGVTFLPILLISVCLTVPMLYRMGLFANMNGMEAMLLKMLVFTAGMMILFLMGVMDDLVGVSYRKKFVVQTLCGLLFPLSGLWINNLWGICGLWEIPAWLGMPLTVLLVVYITNAINLIDGIDGLASGLCALSLFTLGVAAVIRQQYVFVILAFAMLGVILPFWVYNVYGNAARGRKLFMGDTGSLTLGYLLSFMLIYMAQQASITFPRGMLLMGFSTMLLPMLDIIRVMAARIKFHRNPFLPDQNHIHHKLLRTGMGGHWVMATLIAVSLLFTGVTVILVRLEVNSTFILVVDIAIWLLFDLVINSFTPKENQIEE